MIKEKGPVAEMVRAILILEGANPETHEGAVTLLSLRFVKTRILPVDIVKKFKILLSRRTDVIIETIDQVRKRLISELET
jgi:uncharacterized protein (UPF0332 family)